MADATFNIDIRVESDGVDDASESVVELSENMVEATKAQTELAKSTGVVGASSFKGATGEMQAFSQASSEAKENTDATGNAVRLFSGFGSIVSGVGSAFGGWAGAAQETKDKIMALVNGAKQKLADMWTSVKTGASNAVGTVKAKLSAAWAAISAGAAGVASAIGPTLSAIGTAIGPALLSVAAGALSAVAAIAAVSVAAIALGAIALGVAASIASWAVGMADAARSASLLTQALSTTSPALAGLEGMMGGVTEKTGIAGDKLQSLAKKLADAKVVSKDMPAALLAIAMQEKALGSQGTAKFIEDIKAGKKSVQELASETKTKLGGIVKKQMLGLDEQSATLKRNLSGVFGGLKIEGLLEGLALMVGLLDKNSASGQAIKFIFETMFQPLIDGASAAFPYIEAGVLGFEIAIMRMYISMKPAIKAFGELMGIDTMSMTQGLSIAATAGKMLGVTVGTLATGVLAAVAYVLLLGKAFMGVVGSAMDAGAAISSAIGNAINIFQSVDLSATGLQMMMGLAKGIVGGASAVIEAITGTIKGAVDTAKGLLGIASPSKVFADIGDNTGKGFAQGVDESAPQAQSAMETMVEPPPTQAGSKSFNGGSIQGNTFIFNGVQGAEDAEARFSELLTKLLEGDALQMGGGEVPA
jgi:hypothetical protein